MKNLFYGLVAAILILNSSCATIAYGTKEKVKIKSNQPGTFIKLNENPSIALQDCVILSKRWVNPTLEISKPGYEPQTFKFRRVSKGSKVLNILGVSFGGSLIFGGGFAALLNTSSLAGTNTQGSIVPAILVGAGIVLVIPPIVDGITKAGNTFTYKELSFDMIPIPATAKTDSIETIACNSVNFKIKPGTVLGSLYMPGKKGFVKSKDIQWEETSNIISEELEVLINNDLNDFGYPVPGLKDKFKNSNDNARYTLNPEIKEIELSQYNYVAGIRSSQSGNLILYETTYTFDHFSKFKITWSVYDNLKEKIVYEETSTTLVSTNEQSFKMVMYKELSGSLKKLMCSADFNKSIKKQKSGTNIQSVSSTNPLQIIEIPVTKPATKLTEVIESAITIEVGSGHGSGFIITSDGYALTNNHVVEGNKNVTVILSNGLSLDAEVVRTDEKSDVALIKINGKGFKATAINIKDVMIGTNIIAIGTPGKKELGQSISKGIIGAKREIENGVFLQTDVSISPGSSGGPVLNEQNEVIGIITAKMIGKGIEGVGFAIPISEALNKLGIQIK